LRPSLSWGRDVWWRFWRQRTAAVAAVLLLFIVVPCALAPLIAPYNPARQFRKDGLTELGEPVPPNSKFLLGTDGLGRDVLSRLIWGGRVSLGIGIAASAIAVVLGLLIGGGGGFLGGATDYLAMRLVDLIMSIPTFFLMLLLVVMLKPGAWVVIFVIALFSWTYPARIFRAQVLVTKQHEFVEAARCVGAPNRRLFVRHMLPHTLPLVIVYLALSIPTTIFTESSLSFLGFGVPPPTASWGGMIQDGMEYYRVAPWIALAPGIAISLSVILFNLVGNGLRDAMDPARRNR
jgi:ABC-type dipeptide/oligopeptide/nickel transport system permease subunit